MPVRQISAAEFVEFWRSAKLVVMTTVEPSGQPNIAPVHTELKVMSIGFLLYDNSPIMWRCPMLHKAFERFLSDAQWSELDTLVVDMPPGTESSRSRSTRSCCGQKPSS